MDRHAAQAYALRAKEVFDGRPAGIWAGFSCFQVPESILLYKGDPSAHVALLLFETGARVSNAAGADHFDVSFKITAGTLARNSGLTRRTVTRALEQLRLDGMIFTKRTGHTSLGRFAANKIVLLDQHTRRPLQATGKFGLLSSNHTGQFVTVPKASLAELKAMKHSREKAVYLSALALGSRELDEIVAASKQDWRKLSRLGRNPFVSGRKYCLGKRLLSHTGGVLVLHDPLTGKPSRRWQNEKVRTYHENAKWEFDLNKVSPSEYRAVIEKLLGQEFYGPADSWMSPTDGLCPLCNDKGGFAVNFAERCFKCHKCSEGSKLGKFVQRLRGTSMADAKAYIKEVISAANEVQI